MLKCIYKVSMKKIILTLITSVLFSSSVALAECNFIINIGDKSTKILKKYGQTNAHVSRTIYDAYSIH